MLITKAVADLQPVDDNSEHGSFEAILSAPTLDRDGDVFKTSEWKTPLPDHITIDIDHGRSVAKTVGSAVPSFDDDGNLRIKGTFASTELGQTVRTLVTEGHIRTMSVAALEDRSAVKAGGAVVREVLNGAFVAIPSNRESVVLSSKALAALDKAAPPPPPPVQDDAEIPAASPKHDDMVQAIHDASVALGADCVGSESTDDPEDLDEDDPKAKSFDGEPIRDVAIVKTKAIEGSVDDLQCRVSEALRSHLNAGPGCDRPYVWCRTLFLDTITTGTVVYEVDGPDGSCGTYSRAFDASGDDIEFGDTATPVELVQAVRPKSVTTEDFEKALDATLKKTSGPEAGEHDDNSPDSERDDDSAVNESDAESDSDTAASDEREKSAEDRVAQATVNAKAAALRLRLSLANSHLTEQEK